MSHLIAKALWPDMSMGEESFRYCGARIDLDFELLTAVESGRLKVYVPLTQGTHTFPIGAALEKARMHIDDLRLFLADRDIGVRFAEHEEKEDRSRWIFGRRLWKLTEAIETIANMPGSGVSSAALSERVSRAADVGKLTERDSMNGEPRKSQELAVWLDVWLYAEDFNKWLEAEGFPEDFRLSDEISNTAGDAHKAPMESAEVDGETAVDATTSAVPRVGVIQVPLPLRFIELMTLRNALGDCGAHSDRSDRDRALDYSAAATLIVDAAKAGLVTPLHGVTRAALKPDVVARWVNKYLPEQWIDVDTRSVAEIGQVSAWLLTLDILTLWARRFWLQSGER